MNISKQLLKFKPYASSWPMIAFLAICGFLIGLSVDAPFIFTFASLSLGIYLFRVDVPIAPLNQKIIISPINGKIIDIQETNSANIWGFEPTEYCTFSIKCGISSAASLHAPALITISDKQIISDNTGIKTFLKATINRPDKGTGQHNLEEIGLVLCQAITYWQPQCEVEVGDIISAGQVFGFLMFGGRVDLLVPNYYSITRILNQSCIAGETLLAEK
ncbi:hypothetical protein OAW28_00805 [Alphaproteobacteria bacterium]|nr:hypothetical protein [Alphaproteobacteria bacterium]